MAAAIPFLIQAAISTAVSMAVTALLAQDTTYTQTGARLDNLSPVGSTYGAPIYLVRGSMRLPGNVIWSKPLREEVQTSTTSAGGKGGGGANYTSTTYTYYASFASLLCAGVMARPIRIWADKKVIWQSPAGETHLTGEFTEGGTFEFFPGSTTQGRSATIEAVLGEATPAYRGRCYIVFADLPVDTYGRRVPNIEVEVESALDPQIAQIVTDICQAAGLTPDQIDTSMLSAAVWGVQIPPGQAGQAIGQLMQGLGLQSVYNGTAIAFRPIDQTVAAEITEGEFLVGDNRFPIKRMREDDLPRSIRISYIDPARDYQPGTQQRIRQTARSVQDVGITSPIAMSADQAAQICDSTLYRAWMGRVRYGPFSLPPKYLFLEPGDVVGITVDGRRHSVRLRTVVVGANGAMECEGEAFDASVLTGAGGGSSGEFAGQELPVFGDTTFVLLNAPPTTDAEASQVGYRLAATGSGRSWKSAALEESGDGGTTWELVTIAPTYCTMGWCDTTLPAPPVNVGDGNLDLASTLDLTLIRGSLSGVTDAQLLGDANLAMLGGEVIQFGAAELIGPRKYRLSRLLRGRQGTDHAMAGHTASESFVLLSTSVFVPLPIAKIHQQRLYRVTPLGGGTAATALFTLTGESARPWSPCYVRATRASGDITMTWLRRSRLGTELPNSGDIPLDEPTESYQLDVLQGGTVVRTIATTTPTAIYTSAQQVADFGALQSAVAIRVYQMSNLLGRGHPASATV
nr:phage tail protein [uncultured Albidiferax sp.]